MPIRVFLISDFCLMLKGIEALLIQAAVRFKLVGSATSYEQAVDMLGQLLPDVIVLDMDSAPDRVLPLITSLRAISDAKILLLTRLDNSILQDKAVTLSCCRRVSGMMWCRAACLMASNYKYGS